MAMRNDSWRLTLPRGFDDEDDFMEVGMTRSREIETIELSFLTCKAITQCDEI
jgi:hypothetical protein